MKRITSLPLPMLGAMLVVVLSLVAGVNSVLTHALGQSTMAQSASEMAIKDGAIIVVGTLGAAFLVCSLIAAVKHAKHVSLGASSAA